MEVPPPPPPPPPPPVTEVRQTSKYEEKEKTKYAHDGFLYVFDKLTTDGSRKMWRCEEKNHGCKTRLHTDSVNNNVIQVRGDHIHGSNAAKVEVAMAVNMKKRRAEDTQEGNIFICISSDTLFL